MPNKQNKVFFDVHSNLVREGPGSYQSTAKAFSYLAGLPSVPQIIDIGCGPGTQTLYLAELSKGIITAIDNHAPFLSYLKQKISNKGLSSRIFPILADINQLRFSPKSFDVIWAEGSIYIIGVEKALTQWKSFLRSNGYIAYTEITWLKDDIPDDLHSFWRTSYPAISSRSRNIEYIKNTGYQFVESFVLPESDWWNDYYNPITEKLPILKEKYKSDTEALNVLENEEKEIALYRKYSSYYGYVFYIGRNI
jgi:ubiquinone/menaquinone biosynthesis C-methylase UbiE